MRRFKKAGAILLATSMAFSASVSALAFDDLEGHWAQQYMEDLNDRGFLNGYTDGTMQPEGEITFVETLSLLSRFYHLSKEEAEFANDDFKEIAEDYLPASMDWAEDEVILCLAAEILSEVELLALKPDEPVNKETLAVLLVRALRLEEEAAEFTVDDLTFLDADKITESYVGYVALLVDLKIVTGDDQNMFNPTEGLSRATASTFVSRGIEYIEDNDIELEIESYDGITKTNGIVYSIGSKTIQLRGFHGLITEYPLTGDEEFLVNGDEESPNSDYEGEYAEILYIDDEISRIEITQDDDIEWYQGEIRDLDDDRNGETIEIYDFYSDDTEEFDLESGTDITIDGDSEDFDELSKGMFVTLQIDDRDLESITAIDADYDMEATIDSIKYGTTIYLRVKDDSGVLNVFPFEATDIPDITRGDIDITIDRLGVGDEVTLELNAGLLDAIEASASKKGVEGELTAITSTATGTSWTIEDDGDANTYMLDTLADAYIGDRSIDIDDISIGDKISVLIYGNVITEVEILSEYSSTDKISGTIIVVDHGDDEMTLLSNSRLVYVDFASAIVISAETGATHTIDELDEELTVTIYGEFTSNSNLKATSIIVES